MRNKKIQRKSEGETRFTGRSSDALVSRDNELELSVKGADRQQIISTRIVQDHSAIAAAGGRFRLWSIGRSKLRFDIFRQLNLHVPLFALRYRTTAVASQISTFSESRSWVDVRGDTLACKDKM